MYSTVIIKSESSMINSRWTFNRKLNEMKYNQAGRMNKKYLDNCSTIFINFPQRKTEEEPRRRSHRFPQEQNLPIRGKRDTYV